MNKVIKSFLFYIKDFIILFSGMFYPREPSQLDTSLSMDQNISTNSIVKRNASFVCLTLNDLPIPPNDQSISTISGGLASPTTIFKSLPQRRKQRHDRHQQQQQKVKQLNGIEINQIHSTSPSVLTLPNLMELAARTAPLPNFSSPMNNIDISIMDSSNKYSYETQTDSDGVDHYRLYSTTENLLRSFSKHDTPISRTSPGINIKMPAVNNNNNVHHKRLSPQRTTPHFPPQQSLPTIESVLNERSIIIGNENTHQSDAMDRVNHILKQLYLPTEKSKRS